MVRRLVEAESQLGVAKDWFQATAPSNGFHGSEGMTCGASGAGGTAASLDSALGDAVGRWTIGITQTLPR